MNRKSKKNKLLLSVLPYSLFLTFFPAVTYAFPGDLTGFVCLLLTTFRIIVPILDGLAILLFFWGVAKFILAAGNEKELAAGRQFMIWGVIAIFILVSFWGIMQFWADQFGFGTARWQVLPTDGTTTTCELRPANSTSIEFGCIPGTTDCVDQ